MLGVGTLGIGLALIFCFIFYPRIAVSYHAVLDPDGFGILGEQLWKIGTLSYTEDEGPTINRGPLYPFLIAWIYSMADRANPQFIQAFQSLLFGITCALTVWLCCKLGNASGLIAGLLVAFHPFVIWYTSRIWVESLAVALFTAITALSIGWLQRPGFGKTLTLGILLGVAALTKGVFLLFAFSVPLLLALWPRSRLPYHQPLVVFISAMLVISPWTYRNYRLTRAFIPVHVNSGFAAALGNTFVDNFPHTGLQLGALHDAGTQYIRQHVPSMPKEGRRWQADLFEELSCLALARQRIQNSPLFLAKKIALNALFFWTLSDTRVKSLVVASLQLPLFGFWLLASWKVFKRDGPRDLKLLPSVMVMIYYLAHLPIIACARYSTVIVPTMIAATIASWFPSRPSLSAAPTPCTGSADNAS